MRSFTWKVAGNAGEKIACDSIRTLLNAHYHPGDEGSRDAASGSIQRKLYAELLSHTVHGQCFPVGAALVDATTLSLT